MFCKEARNLAKYRLDAVEKKKIKPKQTKKKKNKKRKEKKNLSFLPVILHFMEFHFWE